MSWWGGAEPDASETRLKREEDGPNLGVRAERWLWAGALALVGVTVRALVRDLCSPHFEGFVSLVSLALALQSVFMLLSLGRAGPRPLADDAGEPQ